MVLAQLSTSNYSMYLNDGKNCNNNNKPSPPEELKSETDSNNIILKWNNGSDLETPMILLTYNLRVGRTKNGNEIFSGVIPVSPGNVTNSMSKKIENLSDGEYYWSVQTIDTGFMKSEWSKENNFLIDTTPPDISISYPIDNSILGINYINILGKVTDKLSGIDKLILNGNEVPVLSDGTFSKTLSLTEGSNRIAVISIDKAGNKTKKLLTVYLDIIPPEILISLPNEVYDSMLSINGKIKEDLSGIESLKINEVNVNISSNDSFTYNISLYEGDNKIKFEAVDKVGNKITKEIMVKYTKRIILKLQIGNKNMFVND